MRAYCLALLSDAACYACSCAEIVCLSTGATSESVTFLLVLQDADRREGNTTDKAAGLPGLKSEFALTMTTRQDSTVKDPTEPVTATTLDVAYETTGSSMTSLSSRADFYFHCTLVFIAFVGMATNGVVLYAMLAAKEHKKHPLIFNQNLLDFASCLFLATTTSIKLGNSYLTGTSSYWLCLLLLNDGSSWGPFLGSLINLEAITVERYLKVVHEVWAKKKLRNWMIYLAMAFSWIGGIVISEAALIHASRVIDGRCFPLVFWKSQDARKAFGIWYFMSFYVVILLIFIFCYGRILMVTRHQIHVMAAASSSAHQSQLNKIQTSIIKTMILVSLLYFVTYTPLFILSVRRNTSGENKPRDNAFLAAIILSYLYNCTNPFVYATKFDPVRGVLVRMIPCKKTSQPAGENIGMS